MYYHTFAITGDKPFTYYIYMTYIVRVIYNMSQLEVGSIVARKSYGKDIFFKVVDIRETNGGSIAVLKGISYRIEADAPESDLEIQSDQNVKEYRRAAFRQSEIKTRQIANDMYRSNLKKAYYRRTSRDNSQNFKRPGKVLHLDGDEEYLDTCLNEYRKLDIEAEGRYVAEKNQPVQVVELIRKYSPDILVLTGHDGLLKGDNHYQDLSSYRTSRYFIEAVKSSRKLIKDMDSLVIFAGACQSMYKEIIKAGANYASSPSRVLIHALDPVYVCQKIAYTGIEKVVSPGNVISATITGSKGIGGVETRGKYREGYPLETY
jgi:spore coat assemly protein